MCYGWFDRTRPVGRMILVVGGGLLVLGGSPGLNVPKLGYLVVLTACVGLAAARAPKNLRSEWAQSLRPAVKFSGWLALYLSATSVVAIVNGTSLMLWVRDMTGYGLLAACPVLAVDVGGSIKRQTLVRIMAVCGVIAPLGYATDWLARRGVSSLPVNRFVLASFALCFPPFAYALVRAVTGTRRYWWALLAAFIPTALLAAGSRSAVVLFAGVAGLVGSRGKERVNLVRVCGALVIFGALLVFLVPAVVRLTVKEDDFLKTRVDRALTFIHGGDDYSALNRVVEYREASEMFRRNRLFGAGPGAVGYLDTPLLTPAKFGIAGTGMLIVFLGSMVGAFRKGRKRSGWSALQTCARVVFVMFVAYLPLAPPIEDKGFAFGILLLLVMLGVELREDTATDGVDFPTSAKTRAVVSREGC